VHGLPINNNSHRSKPKTTNTNSNNNTTNTNEADVMDDGISAVTHPDPVSVSLKDVTGIAPIETEAETLLMSAIEDAHPAGGRTETNALDNLTAEEDSLFQPSTTATERPLPKSSKRSIFAKSARTDTTAHLWELATTLTSQHQRSHDAATGTGTSTKKMQTIIPNPPQSESTGQSELLALHAANLLSHRKVSSSANVNNANKGTEEATTKNVASKWKTLQTAVQVNAAMDYKKQDDAIPNEVLTEGQNESSEEMNNNDSGHDVEQGNGSPENNPSTNSTRHKKEKKKKSDFEAFR